MIQDSIFENPIPLLNIKNSKLIAKINNYLPYSSAFEVECMQKRSFDIESFKSISDIMAVDCDRDEQRFRVPAGLKGLVCLYNIAEQLVLNSELNPESGIHYHVDCTDIWDYITGEIIESNAEWILKELDRWSPEYTTTSRGISTSKQGCNIPYGGWLRFNGLKTMEFRVGEMTFDYSILAKRMIHCNDIRRRFTIAILEGPDKLELINLRKRLEDMKKSREEEAPELVFTSVAQEVIKSRIKRI